MTTLNLIQNTTGSTIEYNGYPVEPDNWFGIMTNQTIGTVVAVFDLIDYHNNIHMNYKKSSDPDWGWWRRLEIDPHDCDGSEEFINMILKE